MNKEAIVSLKNIGKSFGSTRALESIGLENFTNSPYINISPSYFV